MLTEEAKSKKKIMDEEPNFSVLKLIVNGHETKKELAKILGISMKRLTNILLYLNRKNIIRMNYYGPGDVTYHITFGALLLFNNNL